MASREFYLGNKNLKAAGVNIEWTSETFEEYTKCAEDCHYFIENYVKIINVDVEGGLMLFKPYGYQSNMVDKVVDNRFVICKLPRQAGKTTIMAAILLWYALFNEKFNIGIMAHKAEQAREILGRIQMAFEYLPKWLQQGVVEWNKGSIELENGSKIAAGATSSGGMRGRSYNLIYLDEFAHVEPHLQEDFFTSVFPTISSGQTTKCLITSTPKGLELFCKIWKESEQGKNKYVRIDVHWSDMPGRDEKWKEDMISNTSERQFQQEFECDFMGSSDTLIDGRKLATIPTDNPAEIRNLDFRIHTYPTKGHQYVMCVDSSRGAGLDYSAFTVVDVTKLPYEVVAVYRNNEIASMLYPNVVYQAAKYYNEAVVLVETNDIGQQVADILLHDLEYEGVLMTSNKANSGARLGGGFGGTKTGLGVKTTKSVKRIGCVNLKGLVEHDKLIVKDFLILDELCTFCAKGQSFEAQEGRHDDLAMTLVLFAWLTNQPYFKDIVGNDIRQNMYEENAEWIEQDLLPAPFVTDGQEWETDGFDPL